MTGKIADVGLTEVKPPAVLEPPLVMVPSGVLNSPSGVLVRFQVLFQPSTGSKVDCAWSMEVFVMAAS